MIEFGFDLGWPWLLALLLAAACLAWSYRRAVGRPRGVVRWVLIGLRLAAIGLVTFCLLDPHWVRRIEHRPPLQIVVLQDVSRSMSVQDLPGDRLAAARTWIRDTFAPSIPPHAKVTYFAFNQSLVPLDTNQVGMPGALERLAPSGAATGLGEALEQMLNLTSENPPAAVLLCSDGIETMGGDPLATAREYRRRQIRIHTATFGTTNAMRDVVLENVQVKRQVASRSRTKVLLTLQASGMGRQKVPVELRHGNVTLSQKEVLLSDGRHRVELEFTPRVRGFQVFDVVVPPLPGEWLVENNRRAFGLNVLDLTINVLYMEGSPLQARQPEWKYLKDALQSDPDIEVKTLYRPQMLGGQQVNTVDVDPQTGEKIYHVQHPTEGFPRTLAELLQYDVVINSDIFKEAFSPAQLDHTARLVEEFGGGFVMIGGNTAFGSGGYHRTILDRFIPVAMESDNDIRSSSFAMAIPPGMLSHPLMSLGETFEETQEIWTTKFPRLYGYNRVGRAKPGAVVLGTDPRERTASGPRIILAAQDVGKGRTMAFTSDTTRGWGRDFETIWGEKIDPRRPLSELNCDSRYFRRFWINAIRWLSAGKTATSNAPVSLELAQTVSLPGDVVPTTIRVVDDAGAESSAAQVQVVLSAEGRAPLTFPASYDPAVRLYRADLKADMAGTYTATAKATLHNVELPPDQQLFLAENLDREMLDVKTRHDQMAAVARVSGGTAISPADRKPSEMTALFGQSPPATVELQRHPLWNSYGWLLILVGLLTLEWVLRRTRGLA